MEPIPMNDNIIYFKKGILDTIKLFKTIYKDARNILYYSDQLYINNLEQLLKNTSSMKPYAYTFGEQIVLTSIKDFRENICINPILYLLALETLIESLEDFDWLGQYLGKFEEINTFLKDFYKNSPLPKVRITPQDIKSIFKQYLDNPFLEKVVTESIKNANITIEESKQNLILEDKYYKIKARLISGSIYGQNLKCFITDTLTKELYEKLCAFNFKILVICTETQVEIRNSNLNVVIISKTSMMNYYQDLALLTGFGKGIFNLDIDELNSYSFGQVKEYKFSYSMLYISVNKYFNEDDEKISYLNKKETLNRYYMMQGKNITIQVQEEFLEIVRHIISLSKSLQNSGIFYNEITTLNLIVYNFEFIKDDLIIRTFIKKIYSKYLKLLGINEIEAANMNHGDDYWSLDYYLNTFALLESNVKSLYRIY